MAKRNNIRQLQTKEDKKIFIFCDSMIKSIIGTGVLRDHAIKIRLHAWDTIVEMSDYIKPELYHQLNIIILHCGTNDILSEINTLKKVKKLLKKIEKYHT